MEIITKRIVTGFIITFITLIFSTLTQAKIPSYESVLVPDSKIVAGNPAKNEFFIVAHHTKMVAPLKVALNRAIHQPADKKSSLRILNKTKQGLASKKAMKPLIALNHVKHPLKVKKSTRHPQTALKKTLHRWANRKETSKLHRVLHPSTPVIASKKAASISSALI